MSQLLRLLPAARFVENKRCRRT